MKILQTLLDAELEVPIVLLFLQNSLNLNSEIPSGYESDYWMMEF